MNETPRILVVDDTPENLRLMEALLSHWGYRLEFATSGPEALEIIERDPPDLVLLDVQMPGMDGYDVCRAIRKDPDHQFLPVLVTTATHSSEKLEALKAGADDFVPKPFDQAELRARVASLLRIKTYHDKILQQADDLQELNRTLEARVNEQVEEMTRLGRLRRFLPPQVARVVMSSEEEALLEPHRREIAVLFADLRGFTSFSSECEPEEVIDVLARFHEAMGRLIQRFEATAGYFSGDGVMVFFNDPVPCPAPAHKALDLALALREEIREARSEWTRLGYDLDVGMGIALGFATLGVMGFEGRQDYTAVGTVVNLAARLCENAEPGAILIDPRARAALQDDVEIDEGTVTELKGFIRPVTVYRVTGKKGAVPEVARDRQT